MLVIEVVSVAYKVTLYITGPHALLTSDMTVHDIVKLFGPISSTLIVGDLGGPAYKEHLHT